MAEQLQARVLPDGVISEWHPSKATIRAWSLLSLPIVVVAFFAYMLIAVHGETHAEGSIGLGDILLVVALSLGMFCVHEAVHGVAMFAFGGRPEFGVLKNDGFPVGFYTTTPGHRFNRRQYLVAILAPLAVLAPLGVPACWLPIGGYLVIPFAVQLAGCIGDVSIAWHVLRMPSDAVCEDLRDGTRFWKAAA